MLFRESVPVVRSVVLRSKDNLSNSGILVERQIRAGPNGVGSNESVGPVGPVRSNFVKRVESSAGSTRSPTVATAARLPTDAELIKYVYKLRG